MEFKGTKGKWFANFYTNSITVESENETLICASSHVNNKTERRNYKLISKAPEMLEMLQSIVDGTAFDKETVLIWEHRLEEIEKLIKEATEL